MNLTKKIGATLCLATFLVACSSDKTDKADGSSKSAKEDTVFDNLMSYVPADTPYMMTNSERVPEAVYDAHMQRMKSVVQSFKSLVSKAESKQGDEQKPEDKFALVLMDEFFTDFSMESLKAKGFRPDAHSVVYGLGLTPVARIEIQDASKLKALIANAETKSGYKVQWQKCDGIDCVLAGSGSAKFVVGLTDTQLILSLDDGKTTEALYKNLSGSAKPENAYAVADWKQFVTSNQYTGYSEGFLKLPIFMDRLGALIKAQAQTEQGGSFDAAAFDQCFAVAKKHSDYVSELVFGTKQMDEKVVAMEMLMKTSPEVSAALQALPNDIKSFKGTADPIIAYGMNINMAGLRDGLSQYINFLATTAEQEQCAAIKSEDLRKSIGGLSMAMMMGAGQFKAVSLSVDNIEMDPNTGQPNKLEVFGSVFADDPMALIQMLSMLNPVFATLDVPADGTVTPLPEGLLPPNPVVESVSLSRGGNSLNIFVGNDKPALKDIDLAASTFMWGAADNQRYYSLLDNVMGSMPSENAQDTEEVRALMKSIGDVTGKVRYELGADQRGLLMNYQVSY